MQVGNATAGIDHGKVRAHRVARIDGRFDLLPLPLRQRLDLVVDVADAVVRL